MEMENFEQDELNLVIKQDLKFSSPKYSFALSMFIILRPVLCYTPSFEGVLLVWTRLHLLHIRQDLPDRKSNLNMTFPQSPISFPHFRLEELPNNRTAPAEQGTCPQNCR